MKTGDRVVCIRSHSQSGENGVVKGKIFTIHDVDICSCGFISFDIGIRSLGQSWCPCGKVSDTNGVWLIRSSLFAPIQTKSEFISSDEFTTIEETIDVPIPQETE